MLGNWQKGAIEAKIQITVTKNSVVYNIAGATVTYLYEKPGGTTGTWTATIDNAATGITSYTTTSASDLDTVGRWEVQAKVVLGGGTLYTVKDSFNVMDNVS